MNVEIGIEAVQFPEKEYINEIFVAVQAPLLTSIMCHCNHLDARFWYMSGCVTWMSLSWNNMAMVGQSKLTVNKSIFLRCKGHKSSRVFGINTEESAWEH